MVFFTRIAVALTLFLATSTIAAPMERRGDSDYHGSVPTDIEQLVFDDPHAVCHIDMNEVEATFFFVEGHHYTTIFVDVQKGLDDSGLFPYHIHISPIAHGDLSCNSTGEHWNPYNVPALNYHCDKADQSTCQVGDLAGKYGALQSDEWHGVAPFAISDTKVKLTGDLTVIGRSVVIHHPNGARLACCDIRDIEVKYKDSYDSSSHDSSSHDSSSHDSSSHDSSSHDSSYGGHYSHDSHDSESHNSESHESSSHYHS